MSVPIDLFKIWRENFNPNDIKGFIDENVRCGNCGEYYKLWDFSIINFSQIQDSK